MQHKYGCVAAQHTFNTTHLNDGVKPFFTVAERQNNEDTDATLQHSVMVWLHYSTIIS